ncbi:outer membrane lipoprotein-sorting protein [Anaerosolibacter carboniphilus]|uniref:Outer membrane lipoprotein-sorting protein n=1 Tax=Anaerosolibacter carboniphilus TaxID=1417629 RepID=A0A841KVE1_9FIRM|nr:sigma-E factor regulatory protein RseB domain-containing protein [Anaerosolibacter carboniphilus]MBB6214159.1 outer membrane lipoprotein-sorting protein [Anaerosolibacter carboniphilus]
MEDKEKILSDYIDQLNAERKPKEHENIVGSPELEELFDTVRLIRSLKEPAFPNSDYANKLPSAVKRRLSHKTLIVKPRRPWFMGAAAVAAVFIIVVMLNAMLPFGRTNIVYAMEQAFQEIQAYHGFMEIVEINGEGSEFTQVKVEVWADKEGSYYVKALEGAQKGLITVNNSQKKWQLRPEEKEVYVFSAFPDPYRFTFELGKEVEDVKNALEAKVVGEEIIAGRKASILEVVPKGGAAYRIWVDKETNLPLQKESAMQNGLQYRVTYTKMDLREDIPAELIAYNLPSGFKEINTKPEQIVTNLVEAQEIVEFVPRVPENIPPEYHEDSITVETNTKTVKLNYVTKDQSKRVVLLQNKSINGFKPASTAMIGKIGNSTAEIQSPIQEGIGILGGGGPYAGVTDISAIRWQQDGFEYAVAGNVSLEEMVVFIKGLTDGTVEIPSDGEKASMKPQIEVPMDFEIEENEQKSVDGGHSPWKLDPAFVAQVFVSLKISPEGIQGEYPIKEEALKVIQNTGKETIVEISGDNTPIRRVYLKRLIRQDATGIWTVVGYDPVDER